MRDIRTILATLREHPDGLTPKDLADQLGTYPSAVGTALHRLDRQGYVDRMPDGRYVAIQPVVCA